MSSGVLTSERDSMIDGRLHLPQVTLVAASGTSLAATVRALRLSIEQVRFGAAVLLSHRPPDHPLGPELEWRQIAPLRSREAYSAFMLADLHRHITTDFALCVQWDGYVLRADNWVPDFLDFDYMGAPWPQFHDNRNVGNGGFSLRSRRLLNACASLPAQDGVAEDIAICRTYRTMLEREHGICFAPEAIARRFAYERTPPTGEEFGFHGVFNMMRSMPAPVFSELISGLEPGALGVAEAAEVMRHAALSLRMKTFLAAWRNRRRRKRLNA